MCDGPCFVSRTYLRMSTGSLAGKVIKSAYLHVDVTHTYHCASATATQLYLSNWFDHTTSWNAQPNLDTFQSSGNVTNNAAYCPGGSGMDLPAWDAVQRAANGHWGEVSFALKAANEGSNTGWRKFGLNPYLIVKYNSPPNAPRDLGMQGWGPNPGDALPCVTGAGRPFIATRNPRLRARLSDPDGGMMDAGFRVVRGTTSNHTWDGNQTHVGNVPSGTFAEVTVPNGPIPADGVYGWHLWSGDYELSSWSPGCEMEVDTTPPGGPRVTSAEYPPGADAGGVGKTGTFTVQPAVGTTDVAHYLYSFTSDDPQTRLDPPQLNGPVSVTWTPGVSGPQKLRVRAVDRANNRSPIVTYQIEVNDRQVGVSGRVARWSFEDSLRDTADAKSLTYTGPPPPGGFFGPGHQGRAVLTDAVNTEHYQSKDALVRTDTSFTVSAWAKLGAKDGNGTVVSQDGSRISGFRLQYDKDADRWAMTLADRDADGAPLRRALSAQPPQLDTWTHLTGVYDAAAKKIRLYVNGELSGEADGPVTPWNAQGLFVIGAAKVTGARSQYLTGAVDTLRAHGRALTAAEVIALQAGTNTAAPLVEYLFEDNLVNTGATNDLIHTAPAYTTGYAGKALNTTPLTATFPQSARPLVSTPDSFSVGAWVKLDNKAGYYTVFSQDGPQGSVLALRYSPDVDRWIVGLGEDGTADHLKWAIGVSVPKAGEWTHVAAVHDTATHTLSLYINGVREAQRNISLVFDSTGPFVIGSAQYATKRTGFFRGLIDEVNVYDGPLTGSEVAKLANAPVERARYRLDETSGTTAANALGGPAAPLSGQGISWGQAGGKPAATFTGAYHEHNGVVAGAPPLAQWSLNGTTADSSGNGRDLQQWNNAGTMPATYGTSLSGQAITLNGVDQRLVRQAPIVDTSKSFSVAAWVKLSRDNGWFTVASQDGARTTPFALQYSDTEDRWTFSMTTGDVDNAGAVRAQSALAPKLDAWTHLLGVYDATAGKARLYVNGILEGEVAFTGAWKSGGSFAVGRILWNGVPADFFPGSIDEVRVYDRALGAPDAHGLWHLGSSITGQYDQAFRADRSFTVAAWVRHGGPDEAARQALAFGGDRYSPLLLGYRANTKRWGVLVNAATTPGEFTERWVLSDNEAATYANAAGWVHLAVVYNAPSRQVRLYVNGIPQSSVPGSGSTVVKVDPANPGLNLLYAGRNTAIGDRGRELLIGRATFAGQATDYWKGSVRDVRVFSGVLPEACDDPATTCLSQLPVQ